MHTSSTEELLNSSLSPGCSTGSGYLLISFNHPLIEMVSILPRNQSFRCTFELPDAEGDAVAVLGELGDLLTSPGRSVGVDVC